MPTPISAPLPAPRRKLPMTWLGVAPFLIFAVVFLLLPTANIVTGAFVGDNGAFTLGNLVNLFKPEILNAFALSIRLSLASAVIGCALGFAIAVAVSLGSLPPALRGITMTFSGVTSNFAGVPLSFAYVATLGRVGFVTVLLQEWFGVNIYDLGFDMISFWGLTMAYVFFQIPLMVLIITPAIDGLKREWREAAEVLGATPAHPLARPSGHAGAVVRQCLWRCRHGHRPDRIAPLHRTHPAVQPDPGRCAARPPLGLCAGVRDDRDHRPVQPFVHHDAGAQRKVDQMKRFWAWAIVAFGMCYFFLPLIGMLEFSLKMRRGTYSFDAYTSVLGDPRFRATFGYSAVMAAMTIVLGMLIVVPTVFWVRLKLPKLRPLIEFITLLPLVIPPIVIVFGYIRLFNTSSWLPLTGSALGSDILLMIGYSVLSLPYMYRAVDTGLAAIDVRTLTEAAQSLGAGWATVLAKVILPNVLVAVLSGAFLTFAIVIGEYVFAALLDRPAFGPYLVWAGGNKAYEPAALAVMTFALTWACMALIQLATRFSRHTRLLSK